MLSIKGGQYIMPDGVKKDQGLTIEKGQIQALQFNNKADKTIELEPGDMVFPGFIDLHVHGCGGFDVMEDSEESLRKISQLLASYGLTGWLATTYSSPIVDMTDVGATASWLLGTKSIGAELLGVYHEGPYFSKQKRGAHPESHIQEPNLNDLEELIAPAAAAVVSLAPELPQGIEMIDLLKEQDILISIGHTNATFDQVKKAIKHGATNVTHVFNSMREFNHRDPGTLGAALTCDDLTCEVIADLEHVHPAAIELLVKCKTPKRVAVISNAIPPAGLGDGSYRYIGQHIYVRGNAARLENGSLAGGVVMLNKAVKNLVKTVGLSLLEVSALASTTPASIMALSDHKGQIAVGFDADLSILDQEFNPVYTIVGGNVVFAKKQPEIKEELSELINS